MTDPHHLRAMMRGDHHHDKKSHAKKHKTPKSHLSEELEKEIDAYVDALELEDDPNALQDPKTKREKIRHEIKEEVKLPELSALLESAMGLVISEGERYLSSEDNEKLLTDFANAFKHFEKMQLSDTNEKNLQQLIQISDKTMVSMVKMALAKFAEGIYADCMAIFSLLSILNPGYSEYWYRLGIAAQKCENYDLAIRSYQAASQLDPNLIGARLFAAECFVMQKHPEQARGEIDAAKKIAKEHKVEKMWMDLIPAIEQTIKS